MPTIIQRVRGGKEIPPVEIPDQLPPAEREFVLAALGKDNETDGKFSNTRYGHGALALVIIMSREAELGRSEEEILAKKREYVQDLVEKYGDNILKFLRDDLKLVWESDISSGQ